MFTGIIEALGEITALKKEKSNLLLRVRSDISSQLRPGQSVAHDGICLTITEIAGDIHTAMAVAETLTRSTLGYWKKGDIINLERAIQVSGRLEGHIVQGHVDTVAICADIKNARGSHLLTFACENKTAGLIVPKGSIAINGISLTVTQTRLIRNKQVFSVAVIPYTWQHTNLQCLKIGSKVNIEFDILGKYAVAALKQR